MHAAAASADEAAAFVAFLHSVERILPCLQARERVRAYFEANPPEAALLDASDAPRYCSDLHSYLLGEAPRAERPQAERPRRAEARGPQRAHYSQARRRLPPSLGSLRLA